MENNKLLKILDMEKKLNNFFSIEKYDSQNLTILVVNEHTCCDIVKMMTYLYEYIIFPSECGREMIFRNKNIDLVIEIYKTILDILDNEQAFVKRCISKGTLINNGNYYTKLCNKGDFIVFRQTYDFLKNHINTNTPGYENIPAVIATTSSISKMRKLSKNNCNLFIFKKLLIIRKGHDEIILKEIYNILDQIQFYLYESNNDTIDYNKTISSRFISTISKLLNKYDNCLNDIYRVNDEVIRLELVYNECVKSRLFNIIPNFDILVNYTETSDKISIDIKISSNEVDKMLYTMDFILHVITNSYNKKRSDHIKSIEEV